ncbi:hypothetical protein FB45DRAFT_1050775 [Roridomyces roridus]|uniref:Uncharacterized protein n=1 Tax=Roridomyces roridus TaxID=1738132 RepID=A0AAD7CKJ8_9AGAR|nr:hypothetical protein FB45DRAFT_1050775 [Roridomyces roridus]
MSVTLPIQALLTMQISLEISSDGQVHALEMGQARSLDAPDHMHTQLEGLKLHVQSVATDSTGVKLTMSASIEAANRHQSFLTQLDLPSEQPILECSAGAPTFDFFSQLHTAVEPASFDTPQGFDAFHILCQTLDTHHFQPSMMYPELSWMPSSVSDGLLLPQDVTVFDSETSSRATSPDSSVSPSEYGESSPTLPGSPEPPIATTSFLAVSPRPATHIRTVVHTQQEARRRRKAIVDALSVYHGLRARVLTSTRSVETRSVAAWTAAAV